MTVVLFIPNPQNATEEQVEVAVAHRSALAQASVEGSRALLATPCGLINTALR